MPVYSYKCTSCENIFEEVRRISEYDFPCKEPCSKCGESTVQRHISDAPCFSSTGCRTHLKKDEGFNSVLKKMKKFYRGSTIDVN